MVARSAVEQDRPTHERNDQHMMSSEEFIKRLLDEMPAGQVTLAHLRAVKVFAEKKDDLLVVILLSGVAE